MLLCVFWYWLYCIELSCNAAALDRSPRVSNYTVAVRGALLSGVHYDFQRQMHVHTYKCTGVSSGSGLSRKGHHTRTEKGEDEQKY